MATRWTTGEQLQQACVSRSALWFMAVYRQVIAAGYSAFLIGDDDRRYFTCGWRLPLLVSMYAYTSLLMLVMSHVELFLPRVPFAVHQALLYGGLLAAGAGVVNPLGSFALGLPVGHGDVVAGCTCFVAVLIAGLLALWVCLVSRLQRWPAAVRKLYAQGSLPSPLEKIPEARCPILCGRCHTTFNVIG